MPIIVKDFTWKQMNDMISIQVPLHGIHPSKVDIFTSSQYIKATFESFFFEMLLLHPINIVQSKCVKTENHILFNLKKCSENTWESLEIINLSKDEKNALKKQLIEEEHERIKKSFEEKSNKQTELKRVAVNEQIQLDTKIQNHIDEIRKNEEEKALGDLNKWKGAFETNLKPKSKSKRIKDSNSDNIQVSYSNVNEIRPKSRSKPSIESTIPKPRSARSLQILFTPREFPTPSRESRLDEENEFLMKQAEARRSAGFVDEDLRPEEKNPQYLLAKGKEFLKNNNYLGAISAFSFGIKLSPKFVDLYLARAEAHINIGNFNRTVEDCTNALNLLKPPLPINLNERAICLGRRGLALFKLGFLKQGISELEASVKLRHVFNFENILEECRLEFQEIQLNNQGNTDKGAEKNCF